MIRKLEQIMCKGESCCKMIIFLMIHFKIIIKIIKCVES